jgi:hypothetical protein
VHVTAKLTFLPSFPASDMDSSCLSAILINAFKEKYVISCYLLITILVLVVVVVVVGLLLPPPPLLLYSSQSFHRFDYLLVHLSNTYRSAQSQVHAMHGWLFVRLYSLNFRENLTFLSLIC